MTRLTTEQLEAIRDRTINATSGNRLTNIDSFRASVIVLTEDIPALLAEVSRLYRVLHTIQTETTCDDTWDFVNRELDGMDPLKLVYRIGGGA